MDIGMSFHAHAHAHAQCSGKLKFFVERYTRSPSSVALLQTVLMCVMSLKLLLAMIDSSAIARFANEPFATPAG